MGIIERGGLIPGRFVINDIELSIAPINIQISKESMNFQWQTLRTKSSQKTKSGHANINIQFTVAFIGATDINSKLLPLVAELRYMPFCYVENDFIRDSLFPQEKNSGIAETTSQPTIVLAMQGIQVSASSSSPDTIMATFSMSYFNYLPYIPYWQYKQDSCISTNGKTASSPEDSEAWLDFVAPAINECTPINTGKITSATSLQFLELRTAPKANVNSLTKTKEILDKIAQNPEPFFMHLQTSIDGDLESTLKQTVKRTFGDEFSDSDVVATDLILPILVDGGPKFNPKSKVYNPANKKLDNSKLIAAINGIDQRITARQNANDLAEFTLIEGLDLQDNRGQGFGVFKKTRRLDILPDGLSQNDIIITDITINIQNILASIPLLGHRYSTFQHIGSIDASVEFNIKVMSDKGLKELNWFYDTVNQNMLENRHIPQGLQTIHISNPILQLFNLREFITQDMRVSTTPGSPGTYTAQLSVIESGLKSRDKIGEDSAPNDKFRLEYLANSPEIAKALAKVFAKDIKLERHQFISTSSDPKTTAYNKLLDRYIGPVPYQDVPLQPGPEEFKRQLRNRQLTGLSNPGAVANLFNGASAPDKPNLNSLAVDMNSLVSDDHSLYRLLLGLTEDDVPGISFVQQFVGQELKANRKLSKTNNPELYDLINTPIETAISEAQKNITRENTSLLDKKKELELLLNGSEDTGRLEFQRKLRNRQLTGLSNPEEAANLFNGKPTNVEKLSSRSNKDDLLNTSVVRTWLNFLSNFAEQIIQSDNLGLPQFKPLQDIVNSEGLGRGLPAYPDFQFERLATNSSNIDEILSLDPDCFLFTSIEQSIDKIIDPTLISSAQRFATESYTSATEQIEKYFTDSWFIPEVIGKKLKDAVATNSGISFRKTGEKKDQSIADGSMRSAYYQFPNSKFGNASMSGDITIGKFFDQKQLTSTDSLEVPVSLVPADRDQIQHSLHPATFFGGISTSKNTNTLPDSPSKHPTTQSSHTKKGRRLTNTHEDAGGTIPDPPQELADIASKVCGHKVDVDTYALARMIASEEGSADLQSQQAVALVVVNDAKSNGWSLLKTITHRRGKAYGTFGQQSGRRYSSALDPYESHLAVAEEVISGKVTDFTGGSIKFVNPSQKVFDAQAKKAGSKRANTFAEVDSSWSSSGLASRTIPGINQLVFYYPSKGKPGTNRPLVSTRVPTGGSGSGGSAGAGLSVMQASINEFAKSIRNGQALRLVRAFPTFKFYFIQDDSGNRRRFGADDLFSYNSVLDITCVRSKKIPADLVEITLTNVSGTLSNRKFQAQEPNRDPGKFNTNEKLLDVNGKEVEHDPNAIHTKDTKNENPIASMMVQPGIDVELMLGYANDPSKLTTVFVGKIMEVEFSDSDDLVRLVCQSHAIELVQDMKGLDKPQVEESGIFSKDARTDKIIETLLAEPEVVHFGRWTRSSVSGDGNSNRDLLTNKFHLQPRPQDDNIFTPPVADMNKLNAGFGSGLSASSINSTQTAQAVGTGLGIALAATGGAAAIPIGIALAVISGAALFSDKTKYSMYHTTIWDVMDEMTLRHPGWIKAAVPYKGIHGPRMTMFFGLPSQLYFAADPDWKEKVIGEKLRDDVEQSNKDRSDLVEKLKRFTFARQASNRARTGLSNPEALANHFNQDNKLTGIIDTLANVPKERDFAQERTELAVDFESIKPFRAYHLITAKNHIISNNIRASSKNVFNTVTIQYGNSSFNSSIKQLVQEDTDTFTLKVDAAIPDEEVRELFAEYHNCQTKQMAKNYALALLANQLREAYKGEITIIGNPNIKPHDIVYVFDDYSDLVGPVEVEQVIHKFSQETGFITEITPSMFVTTNEWFNMTASDAMSIIAEGTTSQLINSAPTFNQKFTDSTTAKVGAIATLGLTAAASPLAALIGSGLAIGGYFMLQKLVDFTSNAQPVIMHPLMHHGKPLCGGLPIRKLNDIWMTDKGRWFKESIEGLHLWWDDFGDKLRLAPNQGNITNLFSGNNIAPRF